MTGQRPNSKLTAGARRVKPQLLPGSSMRAIQRGLLAQCLTALTIAAGAAVFYWLAPQVVADHAAMGDDAAARVMSTIAIWRPAALGLTVVSGLISALLLHKLWRLNTNLGNILRGHGIEQLIFEDLPIEQRSRQTRDVIEGRMLVTLGLLLLTPAEIAHKPEFNSVIAHALKRASGPTKTATTLETFQSAIKTIRRNPRTHSAAALLLERVATLRGVR